jgi:hypothetical protein
VNGVTVRAAVTPTCSAREAKYIKYLARLPECYPQACERFLWISHPSAMRRSAPTVSAIIGASPRTASNKPICVKHLGTMPRCYQQPYEHFLWTSAMAA